MIGRRRSAGFRRRAPSQASLAMVRFVNSTEAEVTEPYKVGVPLAAGSFSGSTQRLKDGISFDANANDRFIIATGSVTVPASSSVEVSIIAESGAQTASASKTTAQMLALADALATGGQTGWDVTVTFVDDLTTTTFIASAREAFDTANNTWTISGPTQRAGLFQNTPTCKEYICSAPFMDGVTPSDRLLATWAIAFHSADNFTSVSRVDADLIAINGYRTGTSQRFAGSLTITRGLTAPETVLDLQNRAIEASPLSGTSNVVQMVCPTSTFTLADKGRLFVGDTYSTPTVVQSCNTTISSKTVTVADASALALYMDVTGTGIASDTQIEAIDVGTDTITLSKNATASNTGVSLTFTKVPLVGYISAVSGSTVYIRRNTGSFGLTNDGGTLYGINFEHGQSVMYLTSWPSDPVLRIDRKIAEFRASGMIENNVSQASTASVSNDIAKYYTNLGSHPFAFGSDAADGTSQNTLFVGFDGNEESEFHEARLLNNNVDGSGYCDPTLWEMVLREGYTQVHVNPQFFIETTTGHPSSPSVITSGSSINDVTTFPTGDAPLIRLDQTHPGLNQFFPYMATGRYSLLWAMACQAFRHYVEQKPVTGSPTGFGRLTLSATGSSTSARHHAFTQLGKQTFIACLPSTLPTDILPDARATWITHMENDYQRYIDDFGLDGTTPDVAGEFAMDAYWPTTDAGTEFETRFPAYLCRALLSAASWGTLSTAGTLFLKHNVGAIVGRFRAPQIITYVPNEATRDSVMWDGVFASVPLDAGNKANPWPSIYDAFLADGADQTTWSVRNMFILIHAVDLGLMAHIQANTDEVISMNITKADGPHVTLSGGALDYTDTVNWSSGAEWFCIKPRS